jgi:dienelactone hydrolase
VKLQEDKTGASAEMNVKIYPDSYHGFDHPNAPKERNDAVVGKVITGGNPDAKYDAYDRTRAFLAKFM